LDSHRPHSIREIGSINLVLIAQQIPWSRILWKSLNHLLPRPKRGRMCRDVEVDDLPSVMPQDNETEEDSESNSRDGEEVN